MNADGGDSLQRQRRWTTTPELLTLDPRVSDRAHRLWCRLDRFAGDGSNGGAFPSRVTLTVELDCSLASVDRAVEELVEAGWLTKARRPAGGTNAYTLIDTLSADDEQALRDEIERTRKERRARPVRNGGSRPTSTKSSEPPPVTDAGTLPSVVTGGPITGDGYKEASPKEASVNEGCGVVEVPTEETPPTEVSTVEHPFPTFAKAALADHTTAEKNDWIAAWETVDSIAKAWEPTMHLTKYLADRKRNQKRPVAEEWVKWFVQDEHAAQASAIALAEDERDSRPWYE
jgi:hypothetical protein